MTGGGGRSSWRLAAGAVVAIAVVGTGLAWWFASRTSSDSSEAANACHRRVAAGFSLPADAQFSDFDRRASGDATVIRGTMHVAASPPLTYSCDVRAGVAGSFDVRLSTEGGTANPTECSVLGGGAGIVTPLQREVRVTLRPDTPNSVEIDIAKRWTASDRQAALALNAEGVVGLANVDCASKALTIEVLSGMSEQQRRTLRATLQQHPEVLAIEGL